MLPSGTSNSLPAIVIFTSFSNGRKRGPGLEVIGKRKFRAPGGAAPPAKQKRLRWRAQPFPEFPFPVSIKNENVLFYFTTQLENEDPAGLCIYRRKLCPKVC